ncbi:MAG: metalloregulator ArsR/SmtB family transcription factor [Patescibacteria group bacterium]
MKEKDLERLLKAIANKRRLNILRFLKKKKEASVGDIAEEIKLSFRATSKHLKILDSVDLLDKEQRSIQIFYRFSDSAPELSRRILSILV